MKMYGITLDGRKIGAGIYDMMPEDDQVVVAFGMFPKEWIELAEKLVRGKIGNIGASKYGLEDDKELVKYYAKAVKDDFISEALKEICLGMLDAAKDANKLLA